MKSTSKLAFSIIPFILFCLMAVELVYQYSKETIIEQQKIALTQQLTKVFPLSIEQELKASTLNKNAYPNLPLLPKKENINQSQAWFVCKKNQQNGFILSIRSKEGYSGTIDLLVGISNANKITGIGVLNHQETPGLGDKIERYKSDWIRQFTGHSILSSSWNIKSQQNTNRTHAFDAITAATITSRAVIKIIKKTLQQSSSLIDKNHCSTL